jgi:hypothetical protein
MTSGILLPKLRLVPERQKKILSKSPFMNYNNFLKNKEKKVIKSGFKLPDEQFNQNLFPFQKFIVDRALIAGKYAIFADTGMGKTLMQLEWGYHVSNHTEGKILLLAPLAVTEQTKEQANKFNVDISNFTIINYEQLHNITIEDYSAIILDESSILKNESGKYRQELISRCKNIPYKLACTATPSPNDPMELGNHAEFLDIMSFNEMLAMYFIHDAGETQKWRIKGHAVSRFYEFVSTWAIMLNKPSDIGFEDDGYDLPELKMNEVQVATPTPEGMLFGGLAVNATDFNLSLRETEDQRINEVIKQVEGFGNEQIIIWTKQNQEASNIDNKLKSAGYDCRNVQGSDSPESKKDNLIGFAHKEYQILITKTKIASFGMNFQNCHNQIFSSVDFSFESTYQAIRRSWRFGQDREVNACLITTDRMINVLKAIKQKEHQFRNMQREMTNAVNKHLNNLITTKMENIDDVKTDDYHVMRGDCVQRSKEIADNSADLVIFSPPFAELYTYSSHVEDMGNSTDYEEFVKHFSFLIPELKRVLKPGRICAIHNMDLPIQKGKEGYIGLRDFSGMLIKMFTDNGFIYHSRVTIWKDPVIEMQRTKALGLLHKQVKKDSSMVRVGIPDYVLFFRNEGDNEVPITNTNIPVDLWQKIASPVWYDINYSRTLNYRSARDGNDEKHICPLQLDTIERIILLYTNKGETVFSPFGGIGSEGYQALKMGRKSISIELKASYFDVNKKNHRSAIEENGQLTWLNETS